jgi:hypothetical protein
MSTENKEKVMKKEMLLRNKLLGFSSPENVPVRFTFGEDSQQGFSEDLKPSVRRINVGSETEITEITAIASKGIIVTVWQHSICIKAVK